MTTTESSPPSWSFPFLPPSPVGNAGRSRSPAVAGANNRLRAHGERRLSSVPSVAADGFPVSLLQSFVARLTDRLVDNPTAGGSS